MKTTINASIPIKEQLLSYQVANKQQPKICFNSYKGTIVIIFNILDEEVKQVLQFL